MGRRWYAPTTGGFTARDGVFGELRSPVSLNRYTYANDDPLGYFDPDGRSPWSTLKKAASGAWHGATSVFHSAADTAVRVVRWVSAEAEAATNEVRTAVRTVTTRAASAARRVIHRSTRLLATAGRTLAAPVVACAHSALCRTAVTGVAVMGVAAVCAVCAVGAGVGFGFGLGAGAVTCHGSISCITQTAVIGAAGGALAPLGGEGLSGAIFGGAFAGAGGTAASQTIQGHYAPNAIVRNAAIGAATGGALYGATAGLSTLGRTTLAPNVTAAAATPTSAVTAAEAGGAGERAIVIGEDMEGRVIPKSRELGADVYDPSAAPESEWMENNRKWINDRMDDGCTIYDCGAAPGRANYPNPTSPYYQMELDEIAKRGYPTTWVGGPR